MCTLNFRAGLLLASAAFTAAAPAETGLRYPTREETACEMRGRDFHWRDICVESSPRCSINLREPDGGGGPPGCETDCAARQWRCIVGPF